jgi:hypothetical protein
MLEKSRNETGSLGSNILKRSSFAAVVVGEETRNNMSSPSLDEC